uniref:Proteasome maturation protein n=1 Tax=Podarcis muralis TaxID=64176 RepID=A0A670K5Q6_PODMU
MLWANSRAFGSQLKDCIPVSDLSAAEVFESCDVINRGFTNVKSKLFPVHPLDTPDNFRNFSTLRNIPGLHAPLKLQMEFQAVKLLQRLPFLPSSNLSLDIWKGNCDCIGFEDILNDPAQSEGMGDPHRLI